MMIFPLSLSQVNNAIMCPFVNVNGVRGVKDLRILWNQVGVPSQPLLDEHQLSCLSRDYQVITGSPYMCVCVSKMGI
jgi:hypothetical protein